MKRIITILTLVLMLALGGVAWGADYTSSQSGNWSSDATWGGGGHPGDGDTATANHAVAVDANTTVGTSPADQTTMVLTIGSAGSVTIATDVTLTVRGNIYNNAGTSGSPTNGIILGPGSVLSMDSSAATPDTQAYVIKHGYYACTYAHGTSGNRSEISSLDGYGKAMFTFEQTGRGPGLDFDYNDMYRFGDDTNKSIFARVGTTNYQQTISITNSLFDTCGTIELEAMSTNATITITDSIFQNPAETGTLAVWIIGYVANTNLTINRTIFGCPVYFGPPAGFDVQNTYFSQKVRAASVNAANKKFTTFENNLIRWNSAGAVDMDTDIGSNYLLDDSNYSNPSMINLIADYADRTISGCIIDPSHIAAEATGDYLLQQSHNGYKNIIEQCILLPRPDGKSSGKLSSDASMEADTLVYINRNTYVTHDKGGQGSETGVGVGENANAYAGEVSYFKNNLAWTYPDLGLTGGYKMVRQSQEVQDLVSAANADYNWGWGLSAGSEGAGYDCFDLYQSNTFFSSGTPDTNGGSGDPLFEDYTRNCATYDIAGLGNAAGTAWADATGYVVGNIVSTASAGFYGNDTINFRCINDHTSNDGDATDGQPGVAANWRTNWELATLYRLREDPTRIPTLITWVKAGFVPHNSALDGTGDGGVDIGAMDYESGASPMNIFRHYYQD